MKLETMGADRFAPLGCVMLKLQTMGSGRFCAIAPKSFATHRMLLGGIQGRLAAHRVAGLAAGHDEMDGGTSRQEEEPGALLSPVFW